MEGYGHARRTGVPSSGVQQHRLIAEEMPQTPKVRSVAFYLPQFHPIPENDAWWGRGFTEWTNVVQARPRFPGHYQPHLPADLGFYDLRNPETRAAQAQMARDHGVDAFCYFHYWFNGRRLLERPFEEVLSSGEPDFPFLLCWANENWSRIWDGSDRDILMRQEYSEADDRFHIRSLFRAFADPRYLRIDGRPVFLVYSATRLPDSVRTIEVWRHEAAQAGLKGLYLCRVESHGIDRGDPRPLGFDSAVEFQPDVNRLGRRVQPPKAVRALRRVTRPDDGYRWNSVNDYDSIVSLALSEVQPAYLRFPCVMPSWDNSARRRRDARIIVGSTPEKYGNWLHETIKRFAPPTPDENLVFTNAWNEWAEGNHLEPDLKWGRAYLQAHHAATRPT